MTQKSHEIDVSKQGILPIDQVPNTKTRKNTVVYEKPTGVVSSFYEIKRNQDILLKSADKGFPLRSLKNLLMPDERVGDYGLPGHGPEAKDICGVFYRVGCLNVESHPEGKGVFQSKVTRCFSPKCPVCWGSWALREAGRVEHRIKMVKNIRASFGQPIHVVASVPSSDYWRSIPELRKTAYKQAEKAGFRGGSCIIHPFRQDKFSGLWYFSPHFHLIGFGWIEGTEEVYKTSGWVIKNLGVRKNIFGTAFYQLTHCGVYYGPEKKHNITWFGALSYNKFKKGEIPKGPKRITKCPYCKSEMKRVIWNGAGREPLPCMGQDQFYLAKAEDWHFKGYKEPYLPRESRSLDEYQNIEVGVNMPYRYEGYLSF